MGSQKHFSISIFLQRKTTGPSASQVTTTLTDTMNPSMYTLVTLTTAFAIPILAAPISTAAEDPQCCAIKSTAPEYCDGTAYNATLLNQYVCGDWRLGPVQLPTMLPPLEPLLELYNRFGGLCPGAYLEAWWNTTTRYWNYPDQTGFSVDLSSSGPPGGKAIDGNLILPAGTLIDRFGGERNGIYFSPAAAPYLQRALPPSNLDTPQDDPK